MCAVEKTVFWRIAYQIVQGGKNLHLRYLLSILQDVQCFHLSISIQSFDLWASTLFFCCAKYGAFQCLAANYSINRKEDKNKHKFLQKLHISETHTTFLLVFAQHVTEFILFLALLWRNIFHFHSRINTFYTVTSTKYFFRLTL